MYYKYWMGRPSKTSEQVIYQFCEVHGTRYDYSNVEYRHSLQDVSIVCPIHGAFYQKPAYHIQGHGCRTCARISAAEATRTPQRRELSSNLMSQIALDPDKQLKGKSKIDYSCPQRRSRQALANYQTGKWIRPEYKNEWKRYQQEVKRLTRRSNHRFPTRNRTMHLDHIFSVADAFDASVPPEVVSHWTNLRVMIGSLNTSKGRRSDKTLISLYNDYLQNP